MDATSKDEAATGALSQYRLRSGKLLRDATRAEIVAELEQLYAEIQEVFAHILRQLLSQGKTAQPLSWPRPRYRRHARLTRCPKPKRAPPISRMAAEFPLAPRCLFEDHLCGGLLACASQLLL